MNVLALLLSLLLHAPVGPSGVAVHHVLVLDDSGSMETDFDVHGFALAVPQLFQRFVGAAAPDRLTVMTLAQGSPFGPVLRLAPADYLGYERDNGTYYSKAIAEAVAVARQSSAARIEIALLTDAEPRDPLASAAIDEALADDPRIHFRCFQLGTNDAGDLCKGRTSFARDGFDMARLMATHLAASMGSIPRWGRIDKAGATVAIPLGQYVSRLHLLALGARAGEDFTAEVVIGGKASPLVMDHTRPMLSADEVERSARKGPKSRMELPVGEAPRLALGTVSLDLDPARPERRDEGDPNIGGAERRSTRVSAPELRLVRADGPVAWGVILEYDLVVELVAPASIDPSATTFKARAHLMHKGAHVDDMAALQALGLMPTLEVAGKSLPMQLAPDGWASVEVPTDAASAWTLVARFTSDTAALASPPALVERNGKLAAEVTPNPAPALPPVPAPSTPEPTPPEPTPAAPPTPPTMTAWLPPTLDLPAWTLEHQSLTYTLQVTSSGNVPLTGAEIRKQGLTAAIVIDGSEIPMTLVGDRFEVTRTLPTGPTKLTAELVLRHATGEVRSAPDTMEVLPDAAVRMRPNLDLGTVDAGCDAEARCEPIDLSQSRALDRTALRVTRSDAFDDLVVTLRRGEERYTLSRDGPVELAPSSLPIGVCWAPPGCVDAPPDLHAALTIAPADVRLATPDRLASVRIAARVTPATWLTCNLWWCLIVIGGLITLFIIWGYVRPYAFPSGAFIQVADQERRLAKDPGRPLRSVPHGRRGFYRTATCAIDPSGFTVKRSRPHVIQLKADRAGIALLPRGASLERRQRGQWVPVQSGGRSGERHVLSGATYRVNQNFVFRVLA